MRLPKFARPYWERYQEIIMYLFVGGLTFCISYGSFTLFYNLMSLPHNTANILSIILAVLFAYVANKHLVFRSHLDSVGALLREILSFFGARVITMAVEFGGLALLCDVWLMNPNWGKLLVTIVVILLNYVFSKLFVFRKRKD